MPYNPNKHHRRSIRLKGYDYSRAGAYFITICVQNCACLFGKIVGTPLVGVHNDKPQLILNDAGRMVETQWLALPDRFPNIELHEFIIMPNHFHGILKIGEATNVGVAIAGISNLMNGETNNNPPTNGYSQNGQPNNGQTNNGQPQGIAPTKTVGDMMDAFKSITTVEYIRGIKTLRWKPFDKKLWQRNYYEHIIRDEQSYQNISDYIINNPAKWADDKFYKQ